MSDLSSQRKKVVVLCAALACMGDGTLLPKGPPMLLGVWTGLMVVGLVYAISEFAKLKRQGL